jgi:hypothetical protein
VCTLQQSKHRVRKKLMVFFAKKLSTEKDMTLSMLADVALGDLGKIPTPSRVLAPPACETMTVSFDNAMAIGDQIVVRTQMNVQSVSLVGDVAPRQPVVLQLSPGGKVESVFHMPKGVIAFYGMKAQRLRVGKYMRKRKLAEHKRRMVVQAVAVECGLKGMGCQ